MAQDKNQVVKEHLQKKLVKKAQNTINFMHQKYDSTLATIGVKDRFSIIIWAKKFLENHNILNKVLNKAKQMEEEVRQFKEVFKPLFDKGLLFFQDCNGKLFSKEGYNVLLTQAMMDHSMFEDLEKSLKGEAIVNQLLNDFDILAQLKVMK